MHGLVLQFWDGNWPDRMPRNKNIPPIRERMIMITKERSQALLAVLEKRKPTPEIMERIARVRKELGMAPMAEAPKEVKPEPKKKKKILQEIEVDE